MEKHTRLDSDGLLFLSQLLKAHIDSRTVEIDGNISSESTNDTAAGSRAVYELIAAAVSDRVKAEDLHAVTSEEISGIAEQVWG